MAQVWGPYSAVFFATYELARDVVGDLKREVVMAKSEGFTGPVQDLSMAPDIEAFSPSVVERLGSDGVETANQFHIIAGEEHVVLRVGLDGGVDGTNLDVGVE